MANFWRVLARWLHDAAPTEEEREMLPDRLWGAHQHNDRRHTLEQLVNEGTAAWLPEEVKKATEAWNRNTREQAHDLNEPANSELIQSAAEASSALERKRIQARMKARENPRNNREEY